MLVTLKEALGFAFKFKCVYLGRRNYTRHVALIFFTIGSELLSNMSVLSFHHFSLTSTLSCLWHLSSLILIKFIVISKVEIISSNL